MQQGKQFKSQGGKETAKSRKSPATPSLKGPVIFLILIFVHSVNKQNFLPFNENP